ncbi:MAG: SUMF1/EgtB/PvdO family nonheme iron enzyme [Candidatus Contendobacter sp.]|nr:SUMF1/EgtB/PvdO family nonheme iron enzyme [Candidatus Contendobacter sp.]MDG4558452.1 SUMF1/EgtB/PvdO family nonheme iron enzyme [Candidatus Contendobacter sp.]
MSRDQVFISYSHADKKWLERLRIHLKPLQRDGTIKPWADTDIKPGQLWKEEIEKALARAKVAVLLVSPEFLASEFIHKNELPPLLEASKKEGLTILWVPVESCRYEPTAIAQYQAAHDPAKPLSDMSRPKWNKALVEIVKKIEAVAPPPSSSSSTPAAPPVMTPTAPALPVMQNVHGWSASQVQALQRQTAQALAMEVAFRNALKDGGEGPVMVVIPAGRFLMGSPEGELERRDNERQHEAQVAVFAIGQYAVTVGQFKRFVEARGYRTEAEKGGGIYYWTGNEWKQDPDKSWRNPGFAQTDTHPVVGVSWNDAMVYVDWLNEQTDQRYRLPTEAEWEYACRAGTATPFSFGETINTDQANYDGNYVYGKGRKGVYRQKTVEAGQFPANAWGLHDLHGNVWEWTGSEYDEGYGGAESRIAGDPNSGGPRVLRGGAWNDGPLWLRSAARFGYFPRFWTSSPGSVSPGP